jgi:FkbM family methyltransferase
VSHLGALYRRKIPEPLREPLWHIRRLFRSCVAGPAAERRRHWAYVRRRIGWYRQVVRVDGMALRVDLRDEGVGVPLYVRRAYEPRESAFVRRVLRPGMTVVDVGANLGYYALLAGRAVGPTGRVLAIEPDPQNFELLAENLRANRAGNVSPVNVALGAAPGTALLHRSPDNFGDHRLFGDGTRPTVPVPVVVFDELVDRLGFLDLVKIDVQGYEHHVARGMTRTLARGGVGTVLAEFWPHGIARAGGDPGQFVAVFERAGYRPSVLRDDLGLEPVSYAELDHRLPAFDPDAPDGSYLNLIFTRPGA